MLDLSIIFIFLAWISTLFDGALVTLGRYEAENVLKTTPFKTYLRLLKFFNYHTTFEGLRFLLKAAKFTFKVLFSLFFFLFLSDKETKLLVSFAFMAKSITYILLISYAADLLASLIYYKKPKGCLGFLEIPISFISLFFIPFSALGYFLVSIIHPEIFKPRPLNAKQAALKLRGVLEESGLIHYLDASDKKLMLSLISFKDKIAREIMVPRIKIFSLDINATVQYAVDHTLKEGYSRVPVYQSNVDNIVGILLLKDLLSFYAATESDFDPKLQTSIECLVKPATFTPESKKISHLLQELKSKQSHLAVVVDEWGGTEGIVSIEDILEELVGEIADEYDTDEETFFAPLVSGGWIVDARMSIKDIEKELSVSIPTSPEYDTLGGYIFHKAGEIPKEGYKIHHADFNLEVLSSSERSVDKVKISS